MIQIKRKLLHDTSRYSLKDEEKIIKLKGKLKVTKILFKNVAHKNRAKPANNKFQPVF